MPPRVSRFWKIAAASALALPALAACGDATTHTPDYGSPPDSGFNPGNGGNGDGYGSGNGGGDAGPQCSDDLKRCAESFTYPFNNETSVELRGDYRPGAWTKGDPLAHVGNAWSVTVPVPYNQPVQYKFVVNGTQWVTDPQNPQTVSDGKGNTNSLKSPITCANFTCDEPPPPSDTVCGLPGS